jgi:predicted nucleotidyltransferase
MRGLTLFGSRARSEGHEESDLDLLVLIADVTREERSEVLDIAGPIEIESGIVLSPLVRNAKAWPDGSILASEIERDGVEV